MGIKKYTPYTPSRRNMTGLDFTEITKNAPEKSLTVSLKKNSGRNNQGKITVRFYVGVENKQKREGNRMNKLLYGVAYYYEYLPYDRLEEDIKMMKAAGINVVRIAESTWSTYEKQELSLIHISEPTRPY